MNKRDLFDWFAFAGILMFGFVGSSLFLIYRTLVPIRPPWDAVLFEHPFLTWGDALVLYVPAFLWLCAYLIAVSRYLGLWRGDAKSPYNTGT